MADFVFNKCKEQLMLAGINLTTTTGDTLKMSLHTGAQDKDMDGYANLTNEHAATGNYSTGGASLTKASYLVTLDDTNDYATFRCTTDVTWSSATISASHAVIYDDTNSGKVNLVQFDFSGTKSSTNGTFTVVFDDTGTTGNILRLT